MSEHSNALHEEHDAILSSADALRHFIQCQLGKPPQVDLQIRGQHAEHGLDEPVVDFNIWIGCAVDTIKGAELEMVDSLGVAKVIVNETSLRETSQGQIHNMMSIESVCDEILKAPPADRSLAISNEFIDCDERALQAAAEQCAAMARYLGTVVATPQISGSSQTLATTSFPDNPSARPLFTLTSKWRVDWPISQHSRAADSGRASLPHSPNIVRRDPSNITWRAKLPKAILAGHNGFLRLDDPLPTDHVSIMAAARAKGEVQSSTVSSDENAPVSIRKVALPSWGANQE